MHRIKVRVVEDALDADNTLVRAHLDRESVGVNLMSAPSAGKTALLGRALAPLEDVRACVLEGDVDGLPPRADARSAADSAG